MNPGEARCPECGEAVPLNASGCRRCGARRGPRGWLRSETYDGLDLPGDDDFDYEAFVAREFGGEAGPGGRTGSGRRRFWWWVALITLLAFGWLVLRLPF